MKRSILYLACLPSDLVAWSLVLILWALWGTKLHWEKGVLVAEYKPESWPVRTWYKTWRGTTYGHAVMLHPAHTDATIKHELVHVEQCEVTALFSLIWGSVFMAHSRSLYGLCVVLAFLVANTFTYALMAMLTAVLRGESAYWGSIQEEAAYAMVKENL